MSRKRECACGHDINSHYRDPQTGERCACTGLRCDCRRYYEGKELKTPLLPPNNFDESLTHSGGGKPHLNCQCHKCWEWEYEQAKRMNDWWNPKDGS